VIVGGLRFLFGLFDRCLFTFILLFFAVPKVLQEES